MKDIEIDKVKDGKLKTSEIEFAPDRPIVKRPVFPFFKIENEIIDCGVLGIISSKARFLYIVLKRFYYPQNKKGYIYNNQIVDLAYISKSHINKYIKELESRRLITIIQQSKRFRYRVFRINDINNTLI